MACSQIQPAACFRNAHDMKMFFMFLNDWEKKVE